MDNKEKEEVGLRRKAMRLWLKGMRPRDILKQIARSRPWLCKWATVITHCRRLEIYHRPGQPSQVRLLKTFPYEMPETVRRLCDDFKRQPLHHKMLTML